MIRGTTELVAHIGYPTHTFKSPMIYNPYFEQAAIDAVVVPMSCKPEQYAAFLKSVFTLTNVRGAIITMPHKVSTVSLLDEFTSLVEIAGSCNAVRRARDGRLQGDLFDGEGFVRGVRRKGCKLQGARALVAGCGGVGSAIAASLAAAGVSAMTLFDSHADSARALAQRLARHYSRLEIRTGSRDPAGHDVVVNATPLGMREGDPMPMVVERIAPTTFVGEVVLKEELTPFLKAVQARGCRYQAGIDMLFEQIPAYLEFFGFRATTAEALRSVARIAY